MRGEHLEVVTLNMFGKGSSPHARGALDGSPDDTEPVGIIPACAGSTRSEAGSWL